MAERLEGTLLLEHLLHDLLVAAQTTSAASSNETDLLAGGRVARHCRRVTNVLMVTTTVRMVHGIHRHTAHLRPRVALGLVLVVRVAGLQHGLVNATTAGNNADHRAAVSHDRLLGARWQLDLGLVVIGVLLHDGGVVARAASQNATIAGLALDVANDGTLGH